MHVQQYRPVPADSEVTPLPWDEFTEKLLKLYDAPIRAKRTRAQMKSVLKRMDRPLIRGTSRHLRRRRRRVFGAAESLI